MCAKRHPEPLQADRQVWKKKECMHGACISCSVGRKRDRRGRVCSMRGSSDWMKDHTDMFISM